MDEVIGKIIAIDQAAKAIVKSVKEKNENIDSVIKQELTAKECALEALYQNRLEKKKEEYQTKLEEEKAKKQYLVNMRLEQNQREFERTRKQTIQKILEDITKKVEDC